MAVALVIGNTYPVTDGIFKGEQVILLSTLMDESEEGKKTLKYYCRRIAPTKVDSSGPFVRLQAYELA